MGKSLKLITLLTGPSTSVFSYFSSIISHPILAALETPFSLPLVPLQTLYPLHVQLNFIDTFQAFIIFQALFWSYQDEEEKVPNLRKLITLRMFLPTPLTWWTASYLWRLGLHHNSLKGFSGSVKIELSHVFLEHLEQCCTMWPFAMRKELVPEFKSMYCFFYKGGLSLKMSAGINNVLNDAFQ